MEEKESSTKLHLIAAIPFSVIALVQLIIFSNAYSVAAISWIRLAALIFLAVSLFMGKRNPLPAVGFLILTVLQLFIILSGFREGYYNVETWHYYSDNETSFNLFCILPYLCAFAAFLGSAFIMAAALTDYLPKYKETIKKYWFLPGALCVATLILAFLVFLITRISGGYWTGSYTFIGLWNIPAYLLQGVGMLFAALWAVYPEGLPLPEKDAALLRDDALSGEALSGNGYCGMVKHLLLLVFTFGVWYMIWIYRTTRYLNRVPGEPRQIPSHQVLACLFVPFYKIYWAYKNAQRMDALSNSCGVPSNLTTLCLVLQIINPFVPSMLIQDKINTIALTRPEAAQAAAASSSSGASAGTAPERASASAAAAGAPAPFAAPATSPAPANENPDELPEL